MQILVYNRPGQMTLARPAKRVNGHSGTHADGGELTTTRRTSPGHRARVVDATAQDDRVGGAEDSVLVTCINACGHCGPCRTGRYTDCAIRARMLARRSHGRRTQAARLGHAGATPTSTHLIAEEEALVMLSDLLPMGFERSQLLGKIKPGSRVAIIGAGPVELAALLTAQVHSPADIIMLDADDNRLAVGKHFGATATVNSSGRTAAQQVMHLTAGRGADTVIEAQGTAAVLKLCEDILAPGGTIAHVRVQSCSEANQQLERLWLLLDRLVLGRSQAHQADASA